ncbi:MAG: nucleotidyl transferase AbiEii/AbiGii toxin family protein [Candidatus Brocadiia bacterium]
MKKAIINRAGSIKAKLLNLARVEKIDFDALLLRYFQERFLYRITISKFNRHFVLKGGLFLIYLNIPKSRATKDMDFLGVGLKNTPADIKRVFAEIADISCDDGVKFDSQSISSEEIKPDTEYPGIRLKINAYLGKARKRLQLDTGFGDAIWPKSNQMVFPTIAGGEPPKIKVYSLESVISEKFEAMVKLAMANSRMKDFYDVYILASNHSFQGKILQKAVGMTFRRRKTPLPDDPLVFRAEFYADKSRQQQWIAFLRKARLDNAPREFKNVMRRITLFLKPAVFSILNKNDLNKVWNAKTGRWAFPRMR